MEPEFFQYFDDGTEVSYFDGLPYCIDYNGDYISLDPSVYGWIDQYGCLNFPTESTFEDPPHEDLKFKGLLLTVLLGSMLMLSAKGDGIINRVVGMIEQYRGGSRLVLNGGLNIPYLYPAVRELEDDILDLSEYFGVDPNLVAITILYESGGDASGDTNLIDVGIGQMTEPTLQTVNKVTTPEERAFIGLPGGRYATIEDIMSNKRIATGYTTALYRYYLNKYQVTDPVVLSRMYNGGPAGLKGHTGDWNLIYSNDVGGLVIESHLGMAGGTIQRLVKSGRISAP